MNFTRVAYPTPEIEDFPATPLTDYANRLRALRKAMGSAALDFLAVYGDRERFANLLFLTGYEPRFEEAVLLVAPQGTSLLLVGNEGWGYAHSVLAAEDVAVGLCPTLSLYGQPRDLVDKGKSLADWIKTFGISAGSRVGLVGSKSFTRMEMRDPERVTDVPVFVAAPFWDLAGADRVTNAADLLVHPSRGLRAAGFTTTARDIAQFEYAAEQSYAGVLRLLNGLRVGMSEAKAASLLAFSGTVPLSYHIALGFGESHVNAGLGSPSPTCKLSIGDPITFGFGLWGANIARTGFGVSEESELPPPARGYVAELAAPYFRCLKDWYEALEIGATGGEVYDRVEWFVEDSQFGVGLNPGHLLHFDEWPATPFSSGSRDDLRSGMFIQCDIIPAPGAPLFGIHTEDGLVLADEALRGDLEREFPRVWARILRRVEFVASSLGINLHPDVLPLSSMMACCCPFLLDAGLVLAADEF